MARSNRRHRREGARDERDLERAIFGGRRTEVKRGAEWIVQPVSAPAAQKPYTCPGCGSAVAVGVAHVVAWRADSWLGDDAALAERRHWHSHCWKIG